MEIRRVIEAADVESAGHLFDGPARPDATVRFLADERHHLLVAYLDDAPAGMVTGVELTHPDKGTEMFLYELAVDERYRRGGIGQALVRALADLAHDRGCYGMWVLTDEGNPPAQATYRSAGGVPEDKLILFSWTFD